jgi:undecaprenyl-diphosphatase
VTDRLLPVRLRTYALALVAACVAMTLVLGAHYANTSQPGRIDRNLDIRIKARLADHHGLLERLVNLGNPQTIVAWSILLALVCLLLRRWRGALLCFVGPAMAGGLTDVVLKPLIDRDYGGAGYSFPSGHTTGAFAVAVCVIVLLLDRNDLYIEVRVLLGLVGVGLAVGVAASVVGLGYHYTTDTVGGFCVALGVILGLAIVIDAIAERWGQRLASSLKRL